jgi:hypothetical protein
LTNKPLLILAFNRPLHIKGLIDSLRPHQPQKILVAIDGPRKNNQKDSEKIAQVLEEINRIDWTADIELRVRDKNLGLRFAVADAVTWAIEKHGEIIVVEDDIKVGPEFFTFMSEMLDTYRDDESVGHISGYNLVPESLLQNPESKARFSIIPESYAWATWERAWGMYEPNLVSTSKTSVSSLKAKLGSLSSALVWKINFHDAKAENISTWAYRWVSALWENELFCISPNRNLISYTGHLEGTHTRLGIKNDEPKLASLVALDGKIRLDVKADQWIQSKIFRSTPFGLARRLFESFVLTLIRLNRDWLSK